ncbi:hypothetical protein [Microbacterium gubbeenense]|uniref:hypothetical protein n=1 Tax=Microbacterium gubbeenense TaxID=159896 RepID=UPI000415CF2A|nr:hypothetical protein [Microbacterium gubbeenense]
MSTTTSRSMASGRNFGVPMLKDGCIQRPSELVGQNVFEGIPVGSAALSETLEAVQQISVDWTEGSTQN